MLKGRLEGKVALISGGTGGQGTTEVKLFCTEGAKVIFGDINDEKGKALETEVRNSGGDATYVHLDVTSESDWQKAVSKSVEIYGQLDILINNAGVIVMKILEDTTEEEWDFVQNVNSKGVFLGSKSVISAMKRSSGGSIVNISSVAGLRYVGKPQVGYSSSKAALIQMTKTTAVIEAKKNIRLNCVVPGLMHTPLVDRLAQKYAGGDYEGFVKKRHNQVPMGKMGESWDVANAVLFLCSDEAKYITGTEIIVDGGLVAATP